MNRRTRAHEVRCELQGERRKTMRNSHGNGYAAYAINYGVVNYTNYIQTTNVTNVTFAPGDQRSRRSRHARRNPQERERKPELLRFCGSCGILDQDKAMRMSDEEFVDGLIDVGRYASMDATRNIGTICSGLGSIGSGVVGAVRCLVGAARSIFS